MTPQWGNLERNEVSRKKRETKAASKKRKTLKKANGSISRPTQ
jgi:hypothetical protein